MSGRRAPAGRLTLLATGGRACFEYGDPESGLACKTWNIDLRTGGAGSRLAHRKIQLMASSSRRGESAGTGEPESDDAALSELVRRTRSIGRLTSAEEARLLERAALGDAASQDRLVAGHLDRVIRLAATRD